MGEKLVIGPKFGGLITAIQPFSIDNETFPILLNAFEWRGRIKRKRGTSQLGRLERYFNSNLALYTSTSPPYSITLDGNGIGNLITGPYSNGTTTFSLDPTGAIIPGTVTLVASGGPTTYTDPTKDGYLTPTGTGGPNTIEYSTGEIVIPSQSNNTVTAIFQYYPSLPVMGLRPLNLRSLLFPSNLGFDTVYSYNIVSAFPNQIYDVSFYKNPPAPSSGKINGYDYVAKTVPTRTSWNGQNYQQFWTVNYENALWATNGTTVPFVSTNVGMQFQAPNTVTWNNLAQMTFVFNAGSPLIVGDWVFVNEFTYGAKVQAQTLNFQTGFVNTSSTDMAGVTTIQVTFPYAKIADQMYSPGIVQFLTNRSDVTKDCLRWYDGDPTSGPTIPPVVNTGLGWVNFAPPLSNLNYSIAGLPPAQYYLVGAKMIVPFKDRLLFIGPIVQTSGGFIAYLQDTVITSQNGTPYYTASFDGTNVISTKTVYYPLLVPGVNTINTEAFGATVNAYWEDQTGLGYFIQAGYEQPIISASPNEDALIMGFTSRQARLVYTGDDINPFNFYIVNSEMGTLSSFSIVNLDRGVLTIGNHGIVLSDQISSQRVDLQIPDSLFEFSLSNNGSERICTARDFINEWVYFTYSSNKSSYIFPNQTLLYNYREDSWAVFNESYTCYGQFHPSTGLTWATVGSKFPTWEVWNEPWNSGPSTVYQPKVIAGTTQGFVMIREDGTGEEPSAYIKNISGSYFITGITNAVSAVVTVNNNYVVGQQVMITQVIGMTQLNGNIYMITAATSTTITLNVDSTAYGVYTGGGVTTPLEPVYSPNHCLNAGDYIVINGALGAIGDTLNGNIYSVVNPTANGFMLNPSDVTINPYLTNGSYFGNATITRMYVPLIQTKQFNPSWVAGRKTRLGMQQYLLTATNNGQITLLIYLSQNAVGSGVQAFNNSPIVPDPNSTNDALIYSTILYTCPELTNLGLTPANINLQMVTADYQEQIWHRMNTSLIGDTVQLGITLNDAQMRDTTFSNQFSEIELHCIVIDTNPSQLLA